MQSAQKKHLFLLEIAKKMKYSYKKEEKMRLKELRIKNKLTQTELANRFNLTQKTIANYETGTTQPPFDILCQLANYFNVSTDYLLEHETKDQFDLGYLTEDKKTAIKMLTTLNHINFIKAFSYISGLYASQN